MFAHPPARTEVKEAEPVPGLLVRAGGGTADNPATTQPDPDRDRVAAVRNLGEKQKMPRHLLTPIGIALSGVLSAIPVHADHNEPARANLMNVRLVSAYGACAAPDILTTGGLPLPACSTTSRVDPGCGYQASGQGKVLLKTIGSGTAIPNTLDIKIILNMTKLDAGCVGEKLCIFANGARVTTDNCSDGDPNSNGCTVGEAALSGALGAAELACCVVDSVGNCKVTTTIETAFFGLDILTGGRTAFSIAGIGVKRTTSVNSPAPASPGFTAGLLGP